MIEAGYVRTMARYNAWQNRQLTAGLAQMSETDLRADRGAFFGSISATLNHILWGDTLWMSRFSSAIPGPDPSVLHTEYTPTFSVWSAERFRLDGAMRMWSDTLRTLDMKTQLSWYSNNLKRGFEQPLELCIAQLFNHQTHHRGQVHAMMTAAGLDAPVSDLIFLPEDE